MNNIISSILNLIKEVFPILFAYKAGKESKENDNLKKENEKLKKYKKIDDREIQKNEVYNESNW